MGYYVRQMARKNEPKWKVQFISAKRADTEGSAAKFLKRSWDIHKDRWLALGFNKSMTLTEARVRARQLNAQRRLKAQEVRRLQIEEEQRQFQDRFTAILPEEFVVEFERRFIRYKDNGTDAGHRKMSRSKLIWRAAQRMIVALQIEPSDWFYHIHDIYDYFRC